MIETTAFSLFAPPYTRLLPLADDEDFPAHPRTFRGAALIWNLSQGDSANHLSRAASRPGGLPLLVVLPPTPLVARLPSPMLRLVEETRPQALLPAVPSPLPHELRLLLCPAGRLEAGELVDYLWWRGLLLDRDTRALVARLFALSAEVTTLSEAARSIYLSRRALGRRFHDRGLPAPSRWLQFFRLLRAALFAQGSTRTLAEIAEALGYPDAFTLSNQMDRLVGVRPSLVRDRLGWEWFFEMWLRQEAELGHLKHRLRGVPSTTQDVV